MLSNQSRHLSARAVPLGPEKRLGIRPEREEVPVGRGGASGVASQGGKPAFCAEVAREIRLRATEAVRAPPHGREGFVHLPASLQHLREHQIPAIGPPPLGTPPRERVQSGHEGRAVWLP